MCFLPSAAAAVAGLLPVPAASAIEILAISGIAEVADALLAEPPVAGIGATAAAGAKS